MPLVFSRTHSGRLSSLGPVPGDHLLDIWSLTALGGQRLVVTMESDDVDAYLELLGTDGTSLASNDDSGSGTNARIEFDTTHPGEYFVIARSFAPGETGSYRIRVGNR